MSSRTTSTATGRRRQLFSPVPEISGNAIKKPIATAGPIISSTVSMFGGKSASAEKAHRKKEVRTRHGLHDCGIGLSFWTKRTE